MNPWNGKTLERAPDKGFVDGTRTDDQTLGVGERIDRYGNESGRYAAPEGTPYGERSLEPFSDKTYNSYEVIKPIEKVSIGQTAPYYFQKGGGTQYLFKETVEYCRTQGYLRLINGK